MQEHDQFLSNIVRFRSPAPLVLKDEYPDDAAAAGYHRLQLLQHRRDVPVIAGRRWLPRLCGRESYVEDRVRVFPVVRQISHETYTLANRADAHHYVQPRHASGRERDSVHGDIVEAAQTRGHPERGRRQILQLVTAGGIRHRRPPHTAPFGNDRYTGQPLSRGVRQTTRDLGVRGPEHPLREYRRDECDYKSGDQPQPHSQADLSFR